MRPEAQLGPAMKPNWAMVVLCFSDRVSDWLYFPQVIVNVHLALLSTASWYAVMIAFLHFLCNRSHESKSSVVVLQFPPNLAGRPSALPMSHPHALKHPAVSAQASDYSSGSEASTVASSRRDALCSVQANSFLKRICVASHRLSETTPMPSIQSPQDRS
jgi:hypothetical protein